MNPNLVEVADSRLRAIVGSLLAVAVVLLAMVPPVREATGSANPWLQLAVTTPSYFWAAWPIHRAVASKARRFASTMDTLVSLGITAAYGWSVAATLSGATASGTVDRLYFDSAAAVTAFVLIGRYIDALSTARGRSALTSLRELGPADVAVLRHDPRSGAWREERIDVTGLDVGMRFVTRPGEKVATDGWIVDGRSAVDASALTGERVPIKVSAGDTVTGATLNTHGRLVIEATRVGADTTLARATALIEGAHGGRATMHRLVDRVCGPFVPVVLAIAASTLLIWLITDHDLAESIPPAIAVLIIASPRTVRLALPAALLCGIDRGARLGVFIKGPPALESAGRVDTVVLDDTDSITTGQASLSDITVVGRLAPDAALTAAAAVMQGSEQPIARALVEAALHRSLQVPAATDVVGLPHAGLRARIKTTQVTVGQSDLFDHVPQTLHTALSRPGTTVLVGWDGRARAALTVIDEVRASSPTAIGRLLDLGLRPQMLTADDPQTAAAVANSAGIAAEDVRAGLSPADKESAVSELQRAGRVVAVVSQRSEDSAALVRADLGIAIGSVDSIAADSADIIAMRSDVEAVVTALRLSRRTLRVMAQNLGWAFGYHAVAIPVAACGLLDPIIAGGAMAACSVVVALNSLRLRSFHG